MHKFIEFLEDVEGNLVVNGHIPAGRRNFFKGERLAILNIDVVVDEHNEIVKDVSDILLCNGDMITTFENQYFKLLESNQ